MEDSNNKPVRKGLHKHFHVSKKDTYFYSFVSLAFLVLVIFKVANRILDWGMATPYITWVDAMQLAVIWAILAIVSDSYYRNYEMKYDK